MTKKTKPAGHKKADHKDHKDHKKVVLKKVDPKKVDHPKKADLKSKVSEKAASKTSPKAAAAKSSIKPKSPAAKATTSVHVSPSAKSKSEKANRLVKVTTGSADKATKGSSLPTSGKQPSPKPTKVSRKAGKSSKKEFDQDLVGDEEVGSEEIPDLSDFDEEKESTGVPLSDDDDLNSDSNDNLLDSSADGEVVLTDAEGRRYCRVKECDQISVVEGYCRFHYLLLWKRIQVRRVILKDGKLERFIEELTSRYPDKFLEMIRKDLRTEKDFMAALAELEIDEAANDAEFEDDSQNYIDEVRGITPEVVIADDDF